jgi:hypothetical protein
LKKKYLEQKLQLKSLDLNNAASADGDRADPSRDETSRLEDELRLLKLAYEKVSKENEAKQQAQIGLKDKLDKAQEGYQTPAKDLEREIRSIKGLNRLVEGTVSSRRKRRKSR